MADSKGLTAWDVTTDPANPQPNIWPECPTCFVPWVWRQGYTMSGTKWAWMRDCKHKATPALVTLDGPYRQEKAS